MTNDHQSRAIIEIENALAVDDPSFLRHFSRMVRRNTLVELLTVGLLAVGAVLLATGLGTSSLGLILSGVSTLISAATLTALWHHRLRRSR